MWSTLVPAAGLLLGVLAAGAAVLWHARRRGLRLSSFRSDRRLRMLERLALSRRAALLLVELDGRTLLIGQSGDRLSLLSAAEARSPSELVHEAR